MIDSVILQIREIFPEWEKEEIALLLAENHGDADIVIQRIAEGHAQKWSSNKTLPRNKKNLPAKSKIFSSKRHLKAENNPPKHASAAIVKEDVVTIKETEVIEAMPISNSEVSQDSQDSQESKNEENVIPTFEGGVSMPSHASCRPMQPTAAPIVIFPIGSPVRADVSFRFKNDCQNTDIKTKNDSASKASSGRGYGSRYTSDEVYLPPGFHIDNSTKSHLVYSSISPANINAFDTRDKTWSRNISTQAKENSWTRLSFNRSEYQSQYLDGNMYFSSSH